MMICVHGSLDPVKDASPVCMRDEKALVLGCVRLFSAPADVVPLLGASRGHPMSPVRPLTREELLPT